MLGSEQRPVEGEDSAALENAVDDRLRQVLIMQHAPHAVSGLFVVKIMARFFRWRSLTTWKSMFAASVPYVR
jgi:hypothetical protein